MNVRAAMAKASRSLSLSHAAPQHHLLDLADGKGWIQALRADIGAIQDRSAAEQAVRFLEAVESLARRLIADVDQEAVSLQQPGRADVLVRVPPETRTGAGAAGAQDALVQAIEFIVCLRRLQPLLFGPWIVVVASEPQMPSRQERRKLRVGSMAFSLISASSNIRSLSPASIGPGTDAQRRVARDTGASHCRLMAETQCWTCWWRWLWALIQPATGSVTVTVFTTER